MTIRTTQEKMRSERRRKSCFVILSFMLFIFAGAYVSLVNLAAVNGAGWQEADRRASLAQSALSLLESEYLSRKQRITLSFAYEQGFQDAKGVRFVPGENRAAVTMR